jgi:rare lipoprotein A
MKPYEVNGVVYRPRAQSNYDEVGIATWYGAQYHNRQTADGELFDMDRATAAHTTLPLPCIVEVTNLDNGRRIRVRVNDRGPFVRGRILDLSREGAKELGFYAKGSARVRVRYVGPAPALGGGSLQMAAYEPPKSVARTYVAPATDAPTPALPPSAGQARVQAAAFAERAHAEAAAAALGGLGEVRIEPLERSGATLWRVIVVAPPGEDARSLAAALTGSGYAGAKILSRE